MTEEQIKSIYLDCGLVESDDGEFIGTHEQWQRADDMIMAEKVDDEIDEWKLNQ